MSILLITSKSDVTTDFIVRHLKSKGSIFYRLNTEEIGNSVSLTLDFSEKTYTLVDSSNGQEIDLLKFVSVYYRRPELNTNFGAIGKNEVSFLRSEMLYVLEGIYKVLDNKFWLNKISAIRNSENKLFQLMIANEIGFITPDSLVSNDPEKVLDFYTTHRENCIIKPIKSGLVEGDGETGVIFTTRVELNESNIDRIVTCPIYIQPLIAKKADIRVTIVGKEVFAALIHTENVTDAISDWRQSDQELAYSEHQLPEEIIEKCLNLMKILSLNFGAIDFVLDQNDQYIFLEINPNGQWAWIEKRLNFKISDAITKILEEQKV